MTRLCCRKEEQQRKLLQRFPRRPRGRQPQSWKEEPEPGLCLRVSLCWAPSNPLASVLSVGGNRSYSFLTYGIIYFSDAIFHGAFDFAFLLVCLVRSWQRHGSDFISGFLVKSFKLEEESVNCDSSSKTGQENSFCHQGACKSPICVQSQIEGLPKACFPLLNKRHGLNISI